MLSNSKNLHIIDERSLCIANSASDSEARCRRVLVPLTHDYSKVQRAEDNVPGDDSVGCR